MIILSSTFASIKELTYFQTQFGQMELYERPARRPGESGNGAQLRRVERGAHGITGGRAHKQNMARMDTFRIPDVTPFFLETVIHFLREAEGGVFDPAGPKPWSF
jgi:hypothetical protein